MDFKKARKMNVIISIIFVLIMLSTSYFIADKDLSQNIILILISIWLVPFFYLSSKSKSK
jgi:hypothetical protein